MHAHLSLRELPYKEVEGGQYTLDPKIINELDQGVLAALVAADNLGRWGVSGYKILDQIRNTIWGKIKQEFYADRSIRAQFIKSVANPAVRDVLTDNNSYVSESKHFTRLFISKIPNDATIVDILNSVKKGIHDPFSIKWDREHISPENKFKAALLFANQKAVDHLLSQRLNIGEFELKVDIARNQGSAAKSLQAPIKCLPPKPERQYFGIQAVKHLESIGVKIEEHFKAYITEVIPAGYAAVEVTKMDLKPTDRNILISTAEFLSVQGWTCAIVEFFNETGIDIMAFKGRRQRAIQCTNRTKETQIKQLFLTAGGAHYWNATDLVFLPYSCIAEKTKPFARYLNLPVQYLTNNNYTEPKNWI